LFSAQIKIQNSKYSITQVEILSRPFVSGIVLNETQVKLAASLSK